VGENGAEGIDRWLAEVRAADAVDSRVRERWLRSQAAESSTWTGILVTLAEAVTPVVVTTSAGRRHTGLVTTVGDDFIGVRRAEEQLTLLAMGAIASVEPLGRGQTTPVDGEANHSSPVSVTLRDVLERAAGDRPRLILTAGGTRVTGQLLAVGADVATVRADGDPPRLTYVSLVSVSEASLLDSG
jgi:hypothetical protein